MTDLEITLLCAEAMGYENPRIQETLSGDKFVTYGPLDQALMPQYWPLQYDAQAMALVKKMNISIGRGTNYFVVEHWYDGKDADNYETAERPTKVIRCSNQSLNRAICECVAKIRRTLP